MNTFAGEKMDKVFHFAGVLGFFLSSFTFVSNQNAFKKGKGLCSYLAPVGQ